MTSQDTDTFTYRGPSLEELVPRIRSELGDDAVIVARRETTSGGVGGLFGQREMGGGAPPGPRGAPPAAAGSPHQRAEAPGRQQGSEPAELSGGRPATGPEVDA